MSPETLRKMINEGETMDVEFKGEAHRHLNDRELLETVICLANRSGETPGYLLIGVEDNGHITGARPRHEAGITDPQRIRALIANNTQPALSCRIEIMVLEEGEILVIEVPSSRTPVGTTKGVYLRRAIGGKGQPECLPFHYHEMQTYQADRGSLDYSALVIPEALWEDLDPLEFERFRRNIRESRGRGDTSLLDLPDLELAKALGAVEANHGVNAVRVLGLLLFGREDSLNRFLPTHEAAFQKLTGIQIVMNEFFRYPLLRVMDELLSRFHTRSQEEEVLVGMLRIGVPDYAERAFREALANAFIHRDYTRLGSVHVQWHPHQIEISNPGGFPEGVRLDNILVTPPRPRNPLLADAFKRAGIVERTARGIDTIFYEQLRNGRLAPHYERSTPTDVILVLPGGKAHLNFVRIVAQENQNGDTLTLDDLLILNGLWLERDLDAARAARLIQKPESEAKGVLGHLIEAGLVESRGGRKDRRYLLSTQTYRRLGEDAANSRQHGFEPLPQEQMILQYVNKQGRITRRETAELCQIGSDQAKRLLKKLVATGKLVQHGEKKGTWYANRP